jgi:hypothetical protein
VSVPRSPVSYFWRFFTKKLWTPILCVPHPRPSFPSLFRRPNVWRRPIPVVARSKAWICGGPLAAIAGSNPSRGHGYLWWVLCCQVVSTSGWSLVQRSPTKCGVSEFDREASIMRRPPGPLGAVAPWQNRTPDKGYQSRTSSLWTVLHLLLFSPSWTPAPYSQTVCSLSHYPDVSNRNYNKFSNSAHSF